MLAVAPEPPDQDEVAALIAEAEARTAALYPAESRHGLDAAALDAQGVRFFVARLHGRAVGCGGFLPDAAGGAELKRMFVTASARGQGIGRAILRTVEDAARADGVALMRLETGVKSAEALALYGRAGYAGCPPFPPYSPDPLSVFMEKRLI